MKGLEKFIGLLLFASCTNNIEMTNMLGETINIEKLIESNDFKPIYCQNNSIVALTKTEHMRIEESKIFNSIQSHLNQINNENYYLFKSVYVYSYYITNELVDVYKIDYKQGDSMKKKFIRFNKDGLITGESLNGWVHCSDFEW